MSKPAPINVDSLSEIALFRDLTAAQLQKFSEILRCKIFPSGKTIINTDQPGEAVFIITSGTVKIHIEQADGADVVVSILGAGDIFGEMSLLDNKTRSASVSTIEETALLWMDKTTFQDCLKHIPQLTFNLACILAKRLRHANHQIQALASREVESRVAHQILIFAERYGKVQANGDILIPIRLTQTDIASMIGASREHTNKVIVSYKERKYISIDHHFHIIVHNHGALSSRCQ
ncbi:MAG: Crp/Fnr family transcriptional regulator [Acidobacteria bacterium]|nr:Crp/Fnr family transcriptional regulator [Acidobacteriota bacterium]